MTDGYCRTRDRRDTPSGDLSSFFVFSLNPFPPGPWEPHWIQYTTDQPTLIRDAELRARPRFLRFGAAGVTFFMAMMGPFGRCFTGVGIDEVAYTSRLSSPCAHTGGTSNDFARYYTGFRGSVSATTLLYGRKHEARIHDSMPTRARACRYWRKFKIVCVGPR